MPRNGSGTYSLPQSPFTPNTVISSAAVNSDFSDIAAALTQSVSADGQTPITGQLKSNYSAGPAFTSNADTTTGFGSSTTGEADIWAGGTKIVEVTSGTVTVTNNLTVTNAFSAGSQTFSGTGGIGIPVGTTGQRAASPAEGTTRFNSTNNNLEAYDGTEWQPASSLNTAYTISASVGSNILTVNILNALTAAAPTTADPLAIRFRDVTLSTGDQTTVVVSSALTMTTNATGASLGSSNSVPFRFWIVAFNNAGTAVLGLINCSTATQIFPLNESTLQSATGISNGATSAGVFYCPNGTTISHSAFKILGYLEYSSGLATAGTYASTPTTLQLVSPSIKKPGDTIQMLFNQTTIAASAANTFVATNIAGTVASTNAVNLMSIDASGWYSTASDAIITATLRRGASTNIGSPVSAGVASVAGNFDGAIAFNVIDAPGTTSSTVYAVYFNSSTGTSDIEAGQIRIQELMG